MVRDSVNTNLMDTVPKACLPAVGGNEMDRRRDQNRSDGLHGSDAVGPDF